MHCKTYPPPPQKKTTLKDVLLGNYVCIYI